MKSLKIILVLAVLAFAFSGLTTSNNVSQEIDEIKVNKTEYNKVVLEKKKRTGTGHA